MVVKKELRDWERSRETGREVKRLRDQGRMKCILETKDHKQNEWNKVSLSRLATFINIDFQFMLSHVK